MSKCTIPPAGWECSRTAGHDGPCAARKSADQAFRDQVMVELAYCYHADLPTSEIADRMIAMFAGRTKALGAVHTLEGGL